MVVHLQYILFLNGVNAEGMLPSNIIPLKSLSSRYRTYIYATGAITDENNACAILTSIPRFTTMHTEKNNPFWTLWPG